MAFFLLCVTIFIMFFQPTTVFPQLEQYQPLRNSALIALMAYILFEEKKGAPFFSIKLNRYFILFAIMQILSSSKIWIQSGIETFNLWIRLGLVYFLVFKSAVNVARIKWVIFMILLGVGFLTYISIKFFVINYVPGTRACGFGWYENSNDLAMILVSVIPLVLLMVNTSKNILLKYLFLGVAGVFAFNILFTSSRNGLLGLSCVGILCLFFSKKVPKFIRGGLLLVLFAGVVGIGVANVLSRGDLSGLTGDSSSEDRKLQWKAGIRMAIANPLFGVGRGEFVYTAVDYQGVKGLAPHNTIIQVFGETGIPGGIFFVLFAVFPVFEGWKMLKKLEKNKPDTEETITFRFLLIALTGFWVCAFFGNRYQEYILFVILSLLAAAKTNLIDKEVTAPLKNTLRQSEGGVL